MINRKLRSTSQKLKLHIVKYQDGVTSGLRIASLLISIFTIVCIIWYHGFFISPAVKHFISIVVHISLIFYTLKYFILYLYSIDKRKYIKSTLGELIIILLLIGNWIGLSFFGVDFKWFNYNNFEDFYLLFIQFYFLVMIVIDISKASTMLTHVHLSPPAMMMISFFALISIGTALLMLPRMTTNGISLVDAMFTATSASCVTGLTVLSTGSSFTFKGQVVIMLLVQFGGLSILSFATFFTIFLTRSSAGLRYQHLVKDLLSTDKLSDSFMLLREIFRATIIIEFSGVLLLFMYWKTTGLFANDSQTFFYSLFHAISAFNNAGFSLWDANLMDSAITASYFPQAVIMILVFLGGIGFVTIRDFFNPSVIRERRKYRWKELQPGSKIILRTTFSLIVIMAILLFCLEYNHSLANKTGIYDKIMTAIFQTVSGRTAGFNMVDVNQFTVPMLLIFILMMFIGASPGSTGGGIKTTTFYVLLKSTWATIRGQKNIEFQKRTIPFELVDKAYSITMMSLMIIFISTFTLAIIEPSFDLVNLLFESASAFTTCGLSTGAAAQFGDIGKLVLIINMYIGRIGTLTIAFALAKRSGESKHQYPDTYFMIG
ncbi:MAG: hypothetical protein IJT51_02765 [Bacteroidales bacterium]|nr:hypothetical protein [Bacteroidales bacterium]